MTPNCSTRPDGEDNLSIGSYEEKSFFQEDLQGMNGVSLLGVEIHKESIYWQRWGRGVT